MTIQNPPEHIGIIMDGNGRWAKKRGLPRSAGHAQGAKTLRKVAEYCEELGVKILTVYAFSTENWKRPKDEVDYLMKLLADYLKQAEKELEGKSTRFRLLGDMTRLTLDLQAAMTRVGEATKDRTGMIVNLAINYGGRQEIIQATRNLAEKVKSGEIDVQDINEETLSAGMYTGGLPDPDIIIRPSGELRISNFMLWQSAYSEFWFSDIYWPDFKKKDLLRAIKEVGERNRRFGGI